MVAGAGQSGRMFETGVKTRNREKTEINDRFVAIAGPENSL